MTMGPEPMRRILWRSVRFGMETGFSPRSEGRDYIPLNPSDARGRTKGANRLGIVGFGEREGKPPEMRELRKRWYAAATNRLAVTRYWDAVRGPCNLLDRNENG